MSPIVDLPDELLWPIVDLVRESFPKTLPALSATCKRLHQPAREAFSTHICLSWKLNKQAPMVRFAKGNCGNGFVRSIRLVPEISILNGFKVRMKIAYDHLDALCACLSCLPNLETFSIHLEDLVNRRCFLPPPVLARIIRALPPSVVNFELDTESIDGIWENRPTDSSPIHLCHAISGLLPQLETLRLRLSCICSELFHSLEPTAMKRPTSKLRRAAIGLGINPDKTSHLGVPSTVVDCKRGNEVLYRNRGTGHADGALAPQGFYGHLLRLNSAGAFPHLERFVLLSWKRESIQVRDVASRAMTEYPCVHQQRIGDGQFLVRVHGDEDYLASYEVFTKAALHEASWYETEGGSRFPFSGKVDTEGHRVDTSALEPYHYSLRGGNGQDTYEQQVVRDFQSFRHVTIHKEE